MTLTHEDLLSISSLLDAKIPSTLHIELQPFKDDVRNMNLYFRSELELIKNDISNIYSELQSVKDDISDIRSELQTVKDDISDIRSELRSVKDDISDLKYRVTRLELHTENVTDKNIQLLAENYLPAAKRYEKASAQIDAMRTDIEIIKGAIERHSEALHKLA